ncbi:hypothetical protein [Rhizorhabdus histidinilytica]|uniref:hypothetical protein n=1 Tax=Rhizorhabdus histidinilytica TaxID=439228 RepID=UPI003220A0E3
MNSDMSSDHGMRISSRWGEEGTPAMAGARQEEGGEIDEHERADEGPARDEEPGETEQPARGEDGQRHRHCEEEEGLARGHAAASWPLGCTAITEGIRSSGILSRSNQP